MSKLFLVSVILIVTSALASDNTAIAQCLKDNNYSEVDFEKFDFEKAAGCSWKKISAQNAKEDLKLKDHMNPPKDHYECTTVYGTSGLPKRICSKNFYLN